MADTITDAEHEALRFPGYVPGLLRRGSPVFVGSKQEPSVVREIVPPEASMTGWVGIHAGWLHPVTHKINLDLTDATGRAHLAWWIARQVKGWRRFDPTKAATFVVQSHRFGGAAVRLDQCWPVRTEEWPHHQEGREWCHVDDPLDLDPNDHRLLPDGSRLVDALALSLVGRHLLAGGGR